jgi:multidrug efflux system outer membrane protein
MTESSRALTAGMSCVLLAAGCAVGPNYRTPKTAVPAVFDQQVAPLYGTAPVATDVWKSFGEPELDALIARAQAQNRGLAQSEARLAQARALRGLTVWGLLPSVTSSASRQRSKPSSLDPFIPPGQGSTLVYKAGFDASWEIDIFGGARRAAEATRRDYEAALADQAALQLSTVAEVAQAWFALRGAQEQLAIQQRNLANVREDESLLQARLEAGRGTELDLSQSRTLLATIEAQVPNTEAEVARQLQRLAVLTVVPAAELRATWLAPTKPLPAPPALVAVGDPLQWLRRRPDIRAAERRLASATAQVGVAESDFLPHLSLTGSFGYTSQTSGQLFDKAAERYAWGPGLSWAFLDLGRVRQRVLQAKARNAEVLAAYDETVLRALEETENALAGFRAASESLAANERGLAAAQRAVEVARARYDAGASDHLALLDAERVQLDFENRRVQALVARATSLATLYKALAGDFAR